MKKTEIIDMYPIATYAITNCLGIEIKEIVHDIDDYVYFVSYPLHKDVWRSCHKRKIYYGKEPYFRFGGNIKLSECIRIH